MHATTGVLLDLVTLAGFSLAIILVFQRLRIPAVMGFIVTGVLIGPGGFGLVHDANTVNTLAELGVVLLLFMVGLEFSLADLRALGSRPVVVGVLHVTITSAVVAVVLLVFRAPPAQAVFFGFLVSLSSTALVIRLYTDRAELQSPHGRLGIGVLLLQDLALVPMAVMTPLLARWNSGAAAEYPDFDDLLRALFKILAAVLIIVVAWRFLPWIVSRASRARSREAFLAAVILVVLGSAWASQAAGLSMALGAFFAGLILAGSDLRSQVAADVLPFRDAFSSVFFISIGMLFMPAVMMRTPEVAVAATLGMVLVKVAAGMAAGRLVRVPWRVTVPVALALAHVGEFSFVLARQGKAAGLLAPEWEQAFIVGALFSIMVTPWLVASAPEWGERFDTWMRTRAGDAPAEPRVAIADPGEAARSGHVIIAGYGLNGRNLARVLRTVHIPHVVVDQNPDAIAVCGTDHSPALLGNAAQPEILRTAGIERAQALVIALSDPFATRHSARLARAMSRHVFIIVRTRYVRELDAFHEAGANVVIPEEFETSIEIFTAVLRQYHVPHNIIQAQVDLLRHERYSLMRGMKLPGPVIEQLDTIMAAGTTETVLVLQHSPAVGRTLADMGLRPAAPRVRDVMAQQPMPSGRPFTPTQLSLEAPTGCEVVAVVRGGHAIIDLETDFRIQVGDTLVLTGAHADIDSAVDRLSPRNEA